MSSGESLIFDTIRIKIAIAMALFPLELLQYYLIEKLIVKRT